MDFTNHPLNKQPIANSQSEKTIKPNSQLVDVWLRDFSDLIERPYVKWFAKRFYRLNQDSVTKAASEARNDGRNPARLFAHLVDKYAKLNS